MTTCFLAPNPVQVTFFIPGTAVPATGAKVFFYQDGTTVKQTVYKDDQAGVAWANPIILDSGGNLPLGGVVWFPQGQVFTVVWAPFNDTDPPGSPYRSIDDLSGINDVSAPTSSTSSFIQAGTGAVSTTVQAQLREVFDVTQFAANGVSGAAVDPTGALDSTLGIQAAINAGYLSGVKFPAGRFSVSSTLTFPLIGSIPYCGPMRGAGACGIAAVLAGAPLAGTVIVTPATFNLPLFKFTSGRGMKFEDFSVFGPGKGVSSSTAFHFDTANSQFTLKDIWVDGWEVAFKNGDPSGSQVNDDQAKFYNVMVRNTTYVVRSYNSQAYIWNFYGCTAENTCNTFLKDETGSSNNGNKVQVFGGFIACTSTVFSLLGGFGTLKADGVHFEPNISTATNMLVDAGTSTANVSVQICVQDCYLNFGNIDYTSANPLMRIDGSGPLKFSGNKIEHGNPIIQLTEGNLGSGGIGASGAYHFSDNNWQYEPQIIRPDTGNGAQYVMTNNVFLNYNKLFAQGSTVNYNGGWIPYRQGQPNGTPVTEYKSDVLPTGGTFQQGDRIRKYTVVANTSAAWYCTSPGTYGASSATGTTNGSTAVISGISAIQNFMVGQYITATFGFPSSTAAMLITSINSNSSTMTLNTNSNSVSTATFAQVNPVWKSEAAIAA
jgi:hypothetical protein